MQLTLEYTQKILLIIPSCTNSALPFSARFIRVNKRIFKHISMDTPKYSFKGGRYGTDTSGLDLVDACVYFFTPLLRPAIDTFYLEEGKSLVEVLGQKTTRTIDKALYNVLYQWKKTFKQSLKDK